MRKEPPDPAQAFASMLEALRVEHGMGPSEIAREAGISRATVWRIAQGDSRRLSYDVGQRIERVYRERRR
ncbi:helix-turn-helix transcriptional regulator [Ensifer sp. Root558]|uniref:helix-turn-helix domain-containing protein n=1 Tax=Ensifer sp. Root558 TaxID=1736558 RepID=UPI00138F45F6|nr:helix-turn-helix transcriptional regulator [Ensifer sp. Root558]